MAKNNKTDQKPSADIKTPNSNEKLSAKEEKDIDKKILAIVKTLLAKKNVKTKIALTTKLTDLGLDSLDLMDLVIDAEKEYNFSFPDAKFNSLQTIGDFVEALKSLIDFKKNKL